MSDPLRRNSASLSPGRVLANSFLDKACRPLTLEIHHRHVAAARAGYAAATSSPVGGCASNRGDALVRAEFGLIPDRPALAVHGLHAQTQLVG